MGSRRGEFELIAAVRERLRAHGVVEGPRLELGSGDDAAIARAEGAMVVSVDAVVEGVHFRVPPFTHRQAGHKALAAALSDLAAMGVAPGEAYVQLGLPAALEDEAVLELADGLGALAATAGVAVAGGDVTAAPALFCAVTAVGHAENVAAPVRRAGAAPGDVVAHTGEVGGAAAGLRLLERPDLEAAVDPEAASALRARQLEPVPRLEAGRALARGGATAMIDISDGVGADARHLAEAGAVRLAIDARRLRLAPGAGEIARAAGLDPLELAVTGGEDYELLVTLPPDRLADASRSLAELGIALTAIGRVEAGAGVDLSGFAGAGRTLGFDQRRT